MGQFAADLVPSQVPTRRRYMVLGLVCACP